MADPLKERISLLQMGEAQGKLRPEHAAELARYRASGLVKSAAPPAPPAPPQPGQPALAAPIDDNTPANPPKGQAAGAAMTKVGASRAMLKQLYHVRDLYDRNMSQGGLAGLKEYNPLSTANQQFDAANDHLPVLARQAFRVAGSGADSDKELGLLTKLQPSRWSFDAANAEKFKALDTTLRGFIDNYGGLAGYSPAQIAKIRNESTYVPPNQRKLPAAPPSQAAPPNAAALRAKYGLK